MAYTTLLTATGKQFDLLSEKYRYTKQDDTYPPLQVSLRRSDRNPIDFSSISSINFSMRDYYDPTSSAKVDHQPCVTVSSTNGTVQYQFQDGDTDTIGAFICEFEVIYMDSSTETFPKDMRLVLLVEGDIS